MKISFSTRRALLHVALHRGFERGCRDGVGRLLPHDEDHWLVIKALKASGR